MQMSLDEAKRILTDGPDDDYVDTVIEKLSEAERVVQEAVDCGEIDSGQAKEFMLYSADKVSQRYLGVGGDW